MGKSQRVRLKDDGAGPEMAPHLVGIDWQTLSFKATRWLRKKFPLTWHECEDVAQEAFAAAFRGFKPERGTKFTTYFWGVAKRTARRRLVKWGARPCPQCEKKRGRRNLHGTMTKLCGESHAQGEEGQIDDSPCANPQCLKGWIREGEIQACFDLNDVCDVPPEDSSPAPSPWRPFGGDHWKWMRVNRPPLWAALCVIREQLNSKERAIWWALVYCPNEDIKAEDLCKILKTTATNVRAIKCRIRAAIKAIMREYLLIDDENDRAKIRIALRTLRECREELGASNSGKAGASCGRRKSTTKGRKGKSRDK